MLWLDNKIKSLVNTINPKDIAFMLAASLEMSKHKKSKVKAQIALDALSLYKPFRSHVFEFYLKQDNKLRCVALSGVGKILTLLYLGRSVHLGSKVHTVFIKKRMKFDTIVDNEVGRRAEFLKKTKIKSSLFLPVDDLGVLVVSRTDKDKFNDYETMFLQNFAKEVFTPSLDLALDNETNMEAAIHDTLTGLFNHGYFKLQLEREVLNAVRNDYDLSLIMIDIDYFKFYNDMHGHPKGDEVLKNVAKILKENVRGGDLVARYGGEEFVVLLINTKLDSAVEKAEDLRKKIASHHFDKEALQPSGDLTISLGVANIPKHASNAKDLLDMADKALYSSKNKGKNMVNIYSKELNSD